MSIKKKSNFEAYLKKVLFATFSAFWNQNAFFLFLIVSLNYILPLKTPIKDKNAFNQRVFDFLATVQSWYIVLLKAEVGKTDDIKSVNNIF